MYNLPHHEPPRRLSMSLSVNILRTCPWTSKTSVYILVCQYITYMSVDLQDLCLYPCLSMYYVHVRGPPRPPRPAPTTTTHHRIQRHCGVLYLEALAAIVCVSCSGPVGCPETLYHRDDALLDIAYVMLIWAAPIPADRWHCSLWP